MITTVKQLKKERPDLVAFFESLSYPKLLEQIYLEVMDGLNMEERVEVFMELCTPNMSYTTYTTNSIRSMVATKQEQDISDFCEIMLEDVKDMSAEEIKFYIEDEIRR